MIRSSALALFILLFTCAHSTRKPAAVTYTYEAPEVGYANHRVTKHQVKLKRTSQSARSSLALISDIVIQSESLSAVERGAGYAIDVKIGGEKTFSLLFDTASSDTWVARSTYLCKNSSLVVVPQTTCNFTRTFAGTYTGQQISNENFKIQYPGNEIVEGTVGHLPVTIGNVTVDSQEMSLADSICFQAQGVDGVMGFAYSSLESVFHGTNATADGDSNEALYNNWLYNAISSKQINPWFALALERGINGSQPTGALALGGLPDLPFSQDNFATTPLLKVNLDGVANGSTSFTFYTITAENVTVGGKQVAPAPMTTIVDSGTSMIYLTPGLAKAVNAAFTPAATLTSGNYVIDCNATAPDSFGIVIGGQTFFINPVDLIPPGTQIGATNRCMTGVQPTNGMHILGDVFLRNVVAVFNVSGSEMKFYHRKDY